MTQNRKVGAADPVNVSRCRSKRIYTRPESDSSLGYVCRVNRNDSPVEHGRGREPKLNASEFSQRPAHEQARTFDFAESSWWRTTAGFLKRRGIAFWATERTRMKHGFGNRKRCPDPCSICVSSVARFFGCGSLLAVDAISGANYDPFAFHWPISSERKDSWRICPTTFTTTHCSSEYPPYVRLKKGGLSGINAPLLEIFSRDGLGKYLDHVFSLNRL